MRFRSIASIAVALAVATAADARASTGPHRLQVLAAAQTVHLFAHLDGPQVASPMACNDGQPPFGLLGWFLLPTLSFGSGDANFTCQVTARTAVLDLGGAIASEDANPTGWVTAGGQELLFRPANLERICDDLLSRFYPAPAPATLDGRPLTTATAVSTPAFEVFLRRGVPGTYWADSVAVGHPGRLAASYCGWKAEVPLTRGRHVIAVDLSAVAGAPTHFRYELTVR